ncbi:MAG TPA: class I SAM-dependent methyltransferase [Candidatus Limnocylindria bacterium]|nr:class I SAM-dependent methyltransferase [Candidatus Limnocylindria bacterium]
MTKRLELARLYWRRMKVEGVPRSLGRMATHPGRLLHHARRIIAADARGTSNPYDHSASRDADVALVAQAAGVATPAAEAVVAEVEQDAPLLTELHERYLRARPERGARFAIGRFKVVYALVRLKRPASVVETGVHDGLSSALILRALERNEAGSLISIDLPSTDLPIGVAGPGWLIPDRLKQRWRLELGDARRLLPRVAAEAAPIGLFLHDSDHSRAHREFEFRTVRPAMAPDGLLVSDDDEPPDTLLDELAAEWSMRHLRNDANGASGPVIGVLVA